MAEEPEQVLPQQRIAAARGDEEGQPKARSSSSSMVAAITAGKANTIISPTTSIAQAKTGMRPSVMPGARVNRTPMISSIAPAMAEISMKPMPSSQQSAPSPASAPCR